MSRSNGKERRTSRRTPTHIDAVARTGQGLRQALQISDLSVGGCAVRASTHPLKLGLTYGLKINGLETLGSVAVWTAGQAAGLEFDRALHPAVADHFAALHPPANEEAARAQMAEDAC